MRPSGSRASPTMASAGFQGSAGIEAPKTGDAAREAAARQLINWYMLDGYPQFIAEYKDFPVMQGVEAPADIPQIYKDANDAYLDDGVPIFSQRLRADYGDFPTLLNEMVAGQRPPRTWPRPCRTRWSRAPRRSAFRATRISSDGTRRPRRDPPLARSRRRSRLGGGTRSVLSGAAPATPRDRSPFDAGSRCCSCSRRSRCCWPSTSCRTCSTSRSRSRTGARSLGGPIHRPGQLRGDGGDRRGGPPSGARSRSRSP